MSSSQRRWYRRTGERVSAKTVSEAHAKAVHAKRFGWPKSPYATPGLSVQPTVADSLERMSDLDWSEHSGFFVSRLVGSLKRLVRCVRTLGLRTGWRYWRLENRAIVNPWIALEWADNCDAMAEKLHASKPALAAAFRDWARELRHAFERYQGTKAPNTKGQR